MGIDPALVAVLLVPAVVAFVVRKTPMWWLAGVAPACVAFYLLSTLTPDQEPHGDIAFDRISRVVEELCAGGLIVYAILLLAWAYSSRRELLNPPKPPAPPPLPPARIV